MKLKFKINAAELPKTEIKRIIHEQLNNAIEYAENANDVHKAIHEIRKSIKRVRAVLRLIRFETGDSFYRKENTYFRDLSRKISELRDNAVQIRTLDELYAKYKVYIELDVYQSIKTQLQLNLAKLTEKEIEEAGILKEIAQELKNTNLRLSHIPIVENDFRVFKKGLQHIYRNGRRRYQMAINNRDPELLHDWRKFVKYLWYHMQLLEELWPKYFKSNSSWLEDIGERIGEDHDLHVFRMLLASEAPDLIHSSNGEKLIKAIENQRIKKQNAALPIAQFIYYEKPSQFSERIEHYWNANMIFN